MENTAILSKENRKYIEKTFLKAADSGNPKLTPSTEESWGTLSYLNLCLKTGSKQVLPTPQT